MKPWVLKKWNELNDLLDGVLDQIESARFYQLSAKEQQALIDKSREIGRRMNELLEREA